MDEEELKNHNATILEQMHSAAAAVITATLRSLARTDTRIKLRDPESHAVHFDLLQGDLNVVKASGLANGLQSVSDDRMVVPQ